MDNIGIKIQLVTIPETPGVYQFYDSDKKVIYVGKAKNLKKRVNSYFTKKHDDAKTSLLVKKITPTLSLFLMAEKASIAESSVANSLLNCSCVPKFPDADTSIKSITVISLSSSKTFTNGALYRAVTFQSMERTSSPG